MRLSHVNVTMPKGGEAAAREFYSRMLGLPEILKPEAVRKNGGVWFDAGGLDVHLSIEEKRLGPDARRHFGLAYENVQAMREKLERAGFQIEDARELRERRFFVLDPFGNRIEIHDLNWPRA